MTTYGVRLQPQVHHHLRRGINLVADLIAPTLGPVTGFVANQRFNHLAPELLDDSGTIVRRIVQLEHQGVDVGAMIMRNMIWKISEDLGDCGATAAVIARAVFNEGYKLLQAEATTYSELRAELNTALLQVEQYLREHTQALCTEDQLAHVALSAVDDFELAQVLGEIAYLLGPDAYVHVEKHPARSIERIYLEGAHFPAQVPASHFYTENRRVILQNPCIVLIDEALKSDVQLQQLLRFMQDSQPMVLITPNIEHKALNYLIANTNKQKVSLVQLKLTEIERMQAYQDLQLLTGATVIGESRGYPINQVTGDYFGHVQRLEVNNEIVTIVSKQQNHAAVRDLVFQLRAIPHKTPAIQRRLASLEGVLCRLWIGAASEIERDARLELAKRGVKIVSNAQRSGVIAGGGAELYRAGLHLEHILKQSVSRSILQKALSAPLRQLLENAGYENIGVISDKLKTQKTVFDVRTAKITGTSDLRIVDSAEGIIRAVRSAVSSALMALSTDVIVHHRKPKVSMEP